MRLTGDQTSEIIRQSATRPDERKRRIENWRQQLNHQGQQIIHDWGLEVAPELLPINARVLNAPKGGSTFNHAAAYILFLTREQCRTLATTPLNLMNWRPALGICATKSSVIQVLVCNLGLWSTSLVCLKMKWRTLWVNL